MKDVVQVLALAARVSLGAVPPILIAIAAAAHRLFAQSARRPLSALSVVALASHTAPIASAQSPDGGVPSRGEILRRIGEPGSRSPSDPFKDGKFDLGPGATVVFAGQENLVLEQRSGDLESLLAAHFAEARPRFRSMAWEGDTVYEQWRELNFGDWADQLEAVGADVVIAQFGQMEALDGLDRLGEFTAAYERLLDQFATVTKRLVLVSPMPFEKPPASHAPDLRDHNSHVRSYAAAIRAIAERRGAVYVDLVALTGDGRLTRDGIHLTAHGLSAVARSVAAGLGVAPPDADLAALQRAIIEKNELWFDAWRPANWSFAYGDRVNQLYGKPGGGMPSLQAALERHRPLIAVADARIHALVAGQEPPQIPWPDAATDDAEAPALTPGEQIDTFRVADGYRVNLFASEADGVVNPVQFSWDGSGRLYVACSPSYPQTVAGMPPQDFILVLEDSDRDGRADRSWRFAEGLRMVQGVEPGQGGVYVCDFDRLLHLRDNDGDGKSDEEKVVFAGFGVGDTHQLINSICHGPDGSLWFGQGLHAISRVETPHGIARLNRAGMWRFRPRHLSLESFFDGGMAGANTWGIAFDDFGQVFHKAGDRPEGYWSVPGLVAPAGEGEATKLADAAYRRSPEQYHSVGDLFQSSPKTTSIDIIGTAALPAEVQGCAVIGGYFGSVVELHRFHDDGAGFRTSQLPKLMRASDPSFRPVDVSVGPDGAIYLADWFNPVIGHYQASYADPRRDKSHGRIWRISSDELPPVAPPDLAPMTAAELIDQLGSAERWVRYQAKRLLFERPTKEVIAAADLRAEAETGERFLMELAGVFQFHRSVRPRLVERLLQSDDFRVRAYGTRVLGDWASRLDRPVDHLLQQVSDDHPRVRIEAVVAASYYREPDAVRVVAGALEQPRDRFLDYAIRQSARSLQDVWEAPLRDGILQVESETQRHYLTELMDEAPRVVPPGQDVYEKACMVCHQPGGKGLSGVYPPLAGSGWLENEDNLIKIVLHGLTGPVDVAGEVYGAGSGSVPMPPMGAMSDQEIADVLNYIRAEFGEGGQVVSPADVDTIRTATTGRSAPWTAAELESED